MEQYPNLIVHFTGTPARLAEMVKDAATDVLVPKPKGEWLARSMTSIIWENLG